MFGESAEDLAQLAAEYHELYSPTNADERLLVDTLINNEWRLRRLRCVEADLWLWLQPKLSSKPAKAARPDWPTPSPGAARPSTASNAS